MAAAGGRASFGFILASVFLEALAFGLIFPVLPRLVLELTGGDAAQSAREYGYLAAVWALANFFAAPILGSISDRFGRRPVILISAFGFALDLAVMAMAPSIGWLLFGRMLSGVTAGSYAAMSAFITDVTEPERRAARFGIFAALYGAGMILGPAAGGLLGEVSPRAPFWAAAGLASIAWLYGFFVLPESLPPEKRDPTQARSINPFRPFGLLATAPGLARLATIGTLVALAATSANTLFILYVAHKFDWTAAQSGLLLTAFSAGNIVVMGGLAPLAGKHLSERVTLLAGLILSGVGFAALALAETSLAFCLACIPTCLGNLCGPPLRALQTLTVSPTEQGRMQGALGGLNALAALFGPLAFTQVYAVAVADGQGGGEAMLMGAGLFVVAVLFAIPRGPRPA